MLSSLVDQLESAAADMRRFFEGDPNRPNFSPLHQLQHYCETRIGLTEDKKERFLCFYFSNVIEYVFYNLAGDTPYASEVHQARVSLASIVPEALERSGKALRDSDDKELLSELASLVNEAVSKVANLNRVKSG